MALTDLLPQLIFDSQRALKWTESTTRASADLAQSPSLFGLESLLSKTSGRSGDFQHEKKNKLNRELYQAAVPRSTYQTAPLLKLTRCRADTDGKFNIPVVKCVSLLSLSFVLPPRARRRTTSVLCILFFAVLPHFAALVRSSPSPSLVLAV